jgi:hypothetical protein
MSELPVVVQQPAEGRDAAGHFVRGNKHEFTIGNQISKGGGNPQIMFLSRLQSELREAVQPDDFRRVIEKLRDMALDGNPYAIKVYLDRVGGAISDQAERAQLIELDEHGNRVDQAAPVMHRSAAQLLGDLIATKKLAQDFGMHGMPFPTDAWLVDRARELAVVLADVIKQRSVELGYASTPATEQWLGELARSGSTASTSEPTRTNGLATPATAGHQPNET